MYGFSHVRAVWWRGGKQFVARLGALSAASVSTPISLSFCPVLLSEDKRQAVNIHWSHGLSVTHTVMDGKGYSGSSKECFQGRVSISGFLASDEWAGCIAYTQWRKGRVCVWVFSWKLIDWAVWADRRREESESVAFLAFSCLVKCSHMCLRINIHLPHCSASTAETLSSPYICCFRK